MADPLDLFFEVGLVCSWIGGFVCCLSGLLLLKGEDFGENWFGVPILDFFLLFSLESSWVIQIQQLKSWLIVFFW